MLTTMRSDCSTGDDLFPAKCLKLSTDIRSFPDAWKIARVSPIPKVESPVESDHYRPIAILPAIKVYEKLVLSHLLEYIDQKRVLHGEIHLDTVRVIRPLAFFYVLETIQFEQ